MRQLADITIAAVFMAECAVIGGSATVLLLASWVLWVGVRPLFCFCIGALAGVLFAVLDIFDEDFPL
jgi:hypothetical protein